MKMASPRPLVNALAAEISLTLEELRADVLVGEHLRGILNVQADALSRLTEGKQMPKELKGVKERAPPPRDDEFYLAWPSEWSTSSTLHAP